MSETRLADVRGQLQTSCCPSSSAVERRPRPGAVVSGAQGRMTSARPCPTTRARRGGARRVIDSYSQCRQRALTRSRPPASFLSRRSGGVQRGRFRLFGPPGSTGLWMCQTGPDPPGSGLQHGATGRGHPSSCAVPGPGLGQALPPGGPWPRRLPACT